MCHCCFGCSQFTYDDTEDEQLLFGSRTQEHFHLLYQLYSPNSNSTSLSVYLKDDVPFLFIAVTFLRGISHFSHG